MRNCIILPVKCLLKILSLFSTSPVVFFQLSSLLHSAFHCIWNSSHFWLNSDRSSEWTSCRGMRKKRKLTFSKEKRNKTVVCLFTQHICVVCVCVWRKKRYMERNIFLIVYLRRCFNEFSNKAATKQKPILFVQIRE